MSATNPPPRPGGARNPFYFTHPERWSLWPFLPLGRRHAEGRLDCSVLYDFKGTSGRLGFSATVFLTNLFLLPQTEAAFLQLPRESFDTPEELLAAGWVVD